MIRVLLADDQQLVREGLARLLRDVDDVEVVGQAANGEQAVEQASRIAVDVVLMDIRMPRLDGIEATRRLRGDDEAPPVLVLTTFDDDEMLSGALRAGAAGFLLKGAPAEDLQRAVRTVAEGGAWLDPAVTGRVLSSYRQTASAPAATGNHHDVLTARELEVLCAMAAGHSNAEIASSLFISELTVKSHIGRIFTKLELRDRPAAIVYAYDHGLVRPGLD